MHIEPGIIQGAKLALSYATAAGAGTYTLKLAWDAVRENGTGALVLRSAAAAIGTFVFFEVLPHFTAGVSEVHFILGTALFLILGAAPAAIGLAIGLLAQGLLLAPSDLPQFAANLTTLLVPLFAVSALAARVIPANTAFADLRYADVLKLSAVYQGGVVAWVAFWAIYGQGAGVDTMAAVMTFGAAYLAVILIEPVADLALLAGAKALRGRTLGGLIQPRVHGAA